MSQTRKRLTVAIIGGTGVFGARLARLLARDGHRLIVAARRGGGALAAELGAESLTLDLREDLTPLFAHKPDIVIDAAGPFQTYGESGQPDSTALLRAAIAAGAHYIDLSDAPEHCARVTALDAEARAAGIVALTGVSTVPALSAAAVHELKRGLDQIDRIESAILPGNRAPRGKAVMQAILAQIGRPLRIRRGGAWWPSRGWSEPKVYDLPGGLKRRAYLIGAPDHELFGAHFGAQSVEFRAGLELGIMGWGLDALSRLRALYDFPIPLAPVSFGAWALAPFGTDRGGMVVAVTGRVGQGWERRSWRLVARSGHGPSVPAIAGRVLVDKMHDLAPGARAALDELSLADAEAGMADLDISFTRDSVAVTPLFEAALGEDFSTLAPAVRDSHAWVDAKRFAGWARVTRGQGLYQNLIARLFGFPPAAEDVPVEVLKLRRGDGEIWHRRIGDARFRSVLRLDRGKMTERFGPFTFTIGLTVEDGNLHYPVIGGRLGPVPLPRFLWPRSEAVETAEEEDRFRFDVALYAPLTGQFIVRYEGDLSPVSAEDGGASTLGVAKAS